MAKKQPIRWWSSPRALLRQVLMLDDTPHSIALGTAIGMFIGLTPTVGIQMVLVMVFALLVSPLFSFNRIAAVLTVYISNPLTLVPIYWFLYKVGTVFVGGNLTLDHFAEILEYHNLREWWESVVRLFREVGGPLFVGTLIVATLGGLVTYPATRLLLRSVHRSRPIRHDGEEDSMVATNESSSV